MTFCYSGSILALALAALVAQTVAAQPAGPIQDPAAIRQAAQEFLLAQVSGSVNDTKVSVGQIDNRLNLPACSSMAPFLPGGSKPWGKVTVGVRCAAPATWTIYMSAQVQVTGDYYVAAAALAPGQTLSELDLVKVHGDLASLPVSAVTSPAQAIGHTTSAALASGTILRTEQLRSVPVVQQGQSVRVVSSGPGFQVATDAQALNNASEGQIVKAKTTGGQVLSGIAKVGGIVEVTY